MNFNYLMDLILNPIFSTIFVCIIARHKTLTDRLPIQIYINKIQTRITFKARAGYCLEYLHLKRRNYLEVLKVRQTKAYGYNVLQQEITEALLVYFNVLNNQYQHKSRVLCTSASNKAFSQLLNIIQKYLFRNI